MRPLYAGNSGELLLGSGNAGLWYDKYCNQWSSSWSMSSDGDRSSPKLTWIKQVADGTNRGNRELIAESVMRLQKLTEARHGKFGIFTTASRFVTGLGRSNPVENGFAWHPTLGVPYLAGSSIKGLVRAWARNEAAAPETELQRLLGSEGEPRSAGRVVFLDAIPILPVKLDADVMTPHYAGWTVDKPPGDWREPGPVPFLAVASQTGFVFSLLPRGVERSELDTVFTWLHEALAGAGAGAKTAVGYGRFEYDEARTVLMTTAAGGPRSRPAEVERKGPVRPERLPDMIEVELASSKDALDAFKNARKRRKEKKQPKERHIPVQPIADELRPLATDLVCALLETEGMDELEARTIANDGKPPSFLIALVDLIEREGWRVARRISFKT